MPFGPGTAVLPVHGRMCYGLSLFRPVPFVSLAGVQKWRFIVPQQSRANNRDPFFSRAKIVNMDNYSLPNGLGQRFRVKYQRNTARKRCR